MTQSLMSHRIFLWPASLLFACLLISSSFSQEGVSSKDYRKVVPKPGERCIVCGVELDAEQGDSTLIVHGRRVPVNRMMVDSFMNNEEKYFAQLQPKGALFQEEFDAGGSAALAGLSSGWFLFGLYILVALVFAGMSGYVAVAKGLQPIPHFFIGFFFSALGFLYVLTRPSQVKAGEVPSGLVKVPATYEPVPCPQCSYTNHPSAKRCAQCGYELKPAMQSEVERT